MTAPTSTSTSTSSCRTCPRYGKVKIEGRAEDTSTEIMVIFKAPGNGEARWNIPLYTRHPCLEECVEIGRSYNIDFTKFYFTNMVKCVDRRGVEVPDRKMMEDCFKLVGLKEIADRNPTIIVCVGRDVTFTLLGMRGSYHRLKNLGKNIMMVEMDGVLRAIYPIHYPNRGRNNRERIRGLFERMSDEKLMKELRRIKSYNSVVKEVR